MHRKKRKIEPKSLRHGAFCKGDIRTFGIKTITSIALNIRFALKS